MTTLNDGYQYPPVCTLRVYWADSHNDDGADVYRIKLPKDDWIQGRPYGVHLLSDWFKDWFKSPHGREWRHNAMLYVIHNEGSLEHTIKEVKWLLGRESVEIGEEEWTYEVDSLHVERPITMLEDPGDTGDFPFLYHLTHQHPMRWRLPDPGESDFGEKGMDAQLFSPVR